MIQDSHARAQQLISTARVEGIPTGDEAWLEQHLESCKECEQFAAQTQRAIEALRWVAVSANPELVEATRQRVRLRAHQLAEREARMLPLAASCALAAAVGLVTLASLWQGFAWLGEQWRLPALAWQAGFISAWLLPTAVIAALMLWLRPPAFNGNGRIMQWSPAPRGRQGGE